MGLGGDCVVQEEHRGEAGNAALPGVRELRVGARLAPRQKSLKKHDGFCRKKGPILMCAFRLAPYGIIQLIIYQMSVTTPVERKAGGKTATGQ
jgi:hypothetical protein